ncbi:hypothetical protein ACW5WN_11150 [Aeromonas lacus]
MKLITSSIHGKVMLRHGDKIVQLPKAVLEGLFTLKVSVPCQLLATDGSSVYWYIPGRPPVSAEIPVQSCHPQLPDVRVFSQSNRCMVDTGGNTLWHTASELASQNHISIYQNIYGLLVANPNAFTGHDIHRLRQRVINCPDNKVMRTLSISHAKQLFKESLLPSQNE